MEDIVTVLLATGDNLLQPVVSEMADAQIVGIAVKSEQILDLVEDLLPKVTIIADFMDPGMELVTRLSKHYSKTRVIYIVTSDHEREIKEALVGLEVYDFLPHTFRKSELHMMIREPRGLHHLVGEGLQLEKLIGRPPKLPRNVNASVGEFQKEVVSPRRDIPPEPQSSARTNLPSWNIFDRIAKGLKQSHKQSAEEPPLKAVNDYTPTKKLYANSYEQENNLDQPQEKVPFKNDIGHGSIVQPRVVQANQPISIKVVKQQIVTFWSAKPGTGKTFLAVNTAITLARSGVSVVLVDGDILNLSVGVYLNLMDEKKTLEKALKCDHINEIEQCLIYHSRFPGLAVLSGSDHCRPESYCSVTRENVERLLDYLKTKFDVIIVDTASDIQTVTTFVALHHATRVVLLTNQDYAQVFATKRMFSLLKRLNLPQDKYYLVLNGELKNCKLTRGMVGNMLGMQVSQVIPFVPLQVLDSIFDSQPLILQTGHETLLIRKQIQGLADELFPIASGDKVSFLNSLTKLLSKRGSMSYG